MSIERSAVFALVTVVASAVPLSSRAAEPSSGTGASTDARTEVPNVAYAYTAHGVRAGSIGAAAEGTSLAASRQRFTLGGGAGVWGSPFDRLTLIADAVRSVESGQFAPSMGGIVRLAGGSRDDGWTLGALGKFKVEGFAVGPANEIESEIETGILLTFARNGWHLDLNAIAGAGMGDDGEIDGEARARVARDLGQHVRLGLDGQSRVRFAGANRLAGDRTWDATGGPQLLVAWSHFFGSITSGPTTMSVVRGVGATAVVTVGAMTF